MTPSERIQIISDIANRLSIEDWPIIDLTLRQFKLFFTGEWGIPDKNSYIVEIIQDAEDEILSNLADHLQIYPPLPDKAPVPSHKIIKAIQEIELQKALMVTVSTGGPRIQQVNNEYQERRSTILSLLQDIDLEDPNPFVDLWSWYGKWSDGSLPTYHSRRTYLTELFQPLLDNLMRLKQRKEIERVEPTGWECVDRNIEKNIRLLESGKSEEDFQAVGLLCREAIISLAQAVYRPQDHQSIDGVNPSETDAKRMLENFIVGELTGGQNDEMRRFAKSAYQLSVSLQHRRNANFRQAALCVEATRSLINVVAIISGRRDP